MASTRWTTGNSVGSMERGQNFLDEAMIQLALDEMGAALAPLALAVPPDLDGTGSVALDHNYVYRVDSASRFRHDRISRYLCGADKSIGTGPPNSMQHQYQSQPIQFLKCLLPDVEAGGTSVKDVHGLLERHILDAQARWPHVEWSKESFVRRIIEVLPRDGFLEALQSLCAADFYLAGACLDRSARALSRLENEFVLPAARKTVAKYRDIAVNDLAQTIRERILLPKEDGVPRLAMYEGRAPLGAWMRVVAVRCALLMLRGHKKKPDADDTLKLVVFASQDIELDQIRKRYTEDFRLAFQDALLTLSNQERTILRLHVLDRMTLDDVARLYSVHRATAARRLARIRDALFCSTRERLAQRLQLNPVEFESLVQDLLSRVSLSISTIFGEDQPEEKSKAC